MGPAVSNYQIYRRYPDMVDPGPAKTFVFNDVREDSIDMGNFGVNMAGWPNNPPGILGFARLLSQSRGWFRLCGWPLGNKTLAGPADYPAHQIRGELSRSL